MSIELIRFIINDPSGNFVAGIYAERFVPYAHNEGHGGNFMIGNVVTASLDRFGYTAGDSAGRVTVDSGDFAK